MNKKYQLTQFTEYFGEDEVKRNYAHIVDNKFLKCKTETINITKQTKKTAAQFPCALTKKLSRETTINTGKL